MPDAIAAESKPTEKERRAPEHLALGLPLLAVGFVGLRILIMSRGDSDALRALVQNLNVTAIVLATILSVVTTAALLLLVMENPPVLIPDEVLSPGKKVSPAAIIFFIGIPTVAICWFAMQTKYLIFAGILSGILVLVYLGVLRSGKRKDLFQAVGALYLVVVFAAGSFVLLAQIDVWLPRERLTMAGWWRTDIVYVLSSDEE